MPLDTCLPLPSDTINAGENKTEQNTFLKKETRNKTEDRKPSKDFLQSISYKVA